MLSNLKPMLNAEHLIPPAPAVLAHNGVPTAVEIQAIQNAISQAETMLATFKDEIWRLTKAAENVQSFINQHKGAVSPLRRLPNEILGEIMKHCIPSFDRNTPEEAARVALALASVCSRWRAAAISTPQLWTVVVWTKAKRDLLLMKLLLSRSGECSIELYPGWGLSDKKFPNYLKVIEPQFHRLSYLSADLALKERILSGPHLTRLRIIEITSDMTTREALKVLTHCPGLMDVQIRLGEMDTYDPGNSTHLHVTVLLRKLRLAYYSSPVMFLASITAPYLLDVELFNMDRDEDPDWPQTTFIDFLHRSKASLKRLDLSDVNATAQEMRDLFGTVPDLQDFLFEDQRPAFMYNGIYKHLTTHKRKPILLPMLQTLTIRHDEEEMGPDGLLSMILSRKVVAPLKKVVLGFTAGNIPSFMYGEFAKLRDEAKRIGLALEVQDDCEQVVDITDDPVLRKTLELMARTPSDTDDGDEDED